MSNLANIVSALKKNSSIKDMIKIIGNYQGNDIDKYKFFSKNNYKKNLIYTNKDYELFLICWMPGQISKIHNHSDNGCIFKILEGKMTEFRYDTKNLKLIEKIDYNNKITEFISNETAYHKFGNLGIVPSVSLHLYSPPQQKIRFFS